MIVKSQKQEMLSYLEDTSNIEGKALGVYLPESKAEVLAFIMQCRTEKIPFTVSAGRTGTTGGCVPREGAVISFEKINAILDIDKDNHLMKVQAGATLKDIEDAAAKYNLALRASPTESLACVGGAVSTSASGVRGFGYGSIRNYVKELEICLVDGRVLTLKRGEIFSKGRILEFNKANCEFNFRLPSYTVPGIKSQAGYFIKDNMDLIDIFIGSEGTLGVVISCSLDLQKAAFSAFDGLIFFPKEEIALEFVTSVKDLKTRGVLNPASLEFFDNNSLDLLREDYAFIPDKCWAVYFEQEVEKKTQQEALLEAWEKLLEEKGAMLDKSILADTPKEREKIFDLRHKLPQKINEFLRRHKQVKVASDIAVPDDKFRIMYSFYKDVAENSGLDYVNFGHIGESHLHFNFLPKNAKENQKARGCLEQFYRMAVSLGGTISAEHGIGKIKKPYLRVMYSDREIREMAALKRYFDPDCLLGLDNIFDKKLLLNTD